MELTVRSLKGPRIEFSALADDVTIEALKQRLCSEHSYCSPERQNLVR